MMMDNHSADKMRYPETISVRKTIRKGGQKPTAFHKATYLGLSTRLTKSGIREVRNFRDS
jgi:hypothetical protein